MWYAISRSGGFQAPTQPSQGSKKTATLKPTLRGTPWQRRQFHLQQNTQSYVPKDSMKKNRTNLVTISIRIILAYTRSCCLIT